METPKRYRHWLIGATLGVLLALLIWPPTTWLIRAQLGLAAPVQANRAPWYMNGFGISPSAAEYAVRATHETANHHPDSYRLQLADALTDPPADGNLTPEIKTARLRELETRFPNSPSLYANILRFCALTQVRVHREQEEAEATGEPAMAHASPSSTPVDTPEQLAAFDRDAVEGERLDPDNAYFPLMRAVGLFAGHRDSDALAAIRLAAQKPRWTEYWDDELEGEWQLQVESFGKTGALPRAAVAISTLLPHYAVIRAAARVAIAKAIASEQAGHVDEGLAIRDAVLRCGGLIRVQAPVLIGNLVGISLTRLSILRPGGAPVIPALSERGPKTSSSNQNLRMEQQLATFDLFLQRNGHTEESAAVHAEIGAGVRAREIAVQAAEGGLATPLFKLAVWWTVDLLLLFSALWMLVLGGAAALVARQSRIRAGQGMPSYARWGVVMGLLAAVALTAIVTGKTSVPHPNPALILAVIVCSGLPVLLFTGQDRLRALLAFGISLPGSLLLCSLFVWQIVNGIAWFPQMAWSLSPWAGPEGSALTPPLIPLVLIGLVCATPLVTLATFGILSRIWRVPLSVGVTRGFRGCAAPIACVLLLAYGAMVAITWRQESVADEALTHTFQHEGRFIAAISGKEWPGPAH